MSGQYLFMMICLVCFRSIRSDHDESWMSVGCAAPVFLQHEAEFYRRADECSRPHLHAPKTDHLEQCFYKLYSC